METDIVFLGVKTCGWGQRSVIPDLIRNLFGGEILNPVQDDGIGSG